MLLFFRTHCVQTVIYLQLVARHSHYSSQSLRRLMDGSED
jgi:hypothetical protein